MPSPKTLDPRLLNEDLLHLIALSAKLRKTHAARPRPPGPWRPLPPDPLAWVQQQFPRYFQTPDGRAIPLAPHHEELWHWIFALQPGHPTSSLIAIWPRSGGKSTTSELGAATIGYFGLRRYVLYISSTQAQADDHASNVARALELLGVERSLNKYGVSRGWRANRVRTADGFTLDAVGMDAAIRGAHLDEVRPDLLILDDLDSEHDSPLTIDKKITTLTRAILPAGASSMTVLGVQNLPNTDGIFAQLADGRAEFLLDRMISGPHPALRDLPATDWYALVAHEGGPTTVHITAGSPSWAGQGLAECEALIAKIGISAFLVEAQHEIERLEGDLFKRHWFPIVGNWPRDATCVRAWDFAGTEAVLGGTTDPDWTVGTLMAAARGQFWVVDVQRMRGTPKAVEDLVRQTAAMDGPTVAVWLEQEGGSSGKAVVQDYQRRVLAGFPVHGLHPTGPKLLRAKAVSSAAQAGNVFLVQAPWNGPFLDEVSRAGLPGVHDDILDTLSLAHSALTQQKRAGAYAI